MYFDTLKVSSLEQTAEDTSARGGIGNPNLITWDFGKEITVSLEDALYTPASQSLLWGGKFGLEKTKIKGFWNPICFETDQYGKEIYFKRIDISEDNDEEIIIPTGDIKAFLLNYIVGKYEDSDGPHLKWIARLQQFFSWDLGISDDQQKFSIKNSIDEELYNSIINIVPELKGYMHKPNFTMDNILLGSNLIIDIANSKYLSSAKATYRQLLSLLIQYYIDKGLIISGTAINIAKEDSENIFRYQCPCTGEEKAFVLFPISQKYKYTTEYLGCDADEERKPKIIYGYIEEDNEKPVKYSCDLFLSGTNPPGQPAEKATLFLNNFESFVFSEKQITGTATEEGRYQLKTLASTSSNDGCAPWIMPYSFITHTNNVLFDYEWINCEVQMTSQQGDQDIYYAQHVDVLIRTDSEGFNKKILIKNHNSTDYYNSQIDFYKNAYYTVGTTIIKKSIKVGTFYINDDFNFGSIVQDSFYSFNSGIEDVLYLDRMEKCVAKQTFCINTDRNTLLSYYKDSPKYKQAELAVYIDPKTMKAYEANSDSFQKKDGTIINGNLRIIKQNEVYYKWTRSKAPENTTLGHQIIIDSQHFPGTYRLVGETYARRRSDGKDERYQFEIPLCKMSSNTNLTLQADGDPTTFSMELKVLQRSDGVMMKLTQYEVEDTTYENIISSSKEIVPTTAKYNKESCFTCEEATITVEKRDDSGYEIILPLEEDYYCVPIDCLEPFNTTGQAYLMLPKNDQEAQTIYDAVERYKAKDPTVDIDKYRNILLVMAKSAGMSIFINNEIYKIVDADASLNGDFLVQSSDNVRFTIALGGEG